jgi:glucose-6-phosphate isomerase
MDEWTRFRDVRKNPAALLAACWYRLGDGRGERISVVLPYADRLSLLARYLQQLVMESLGKERDRDGQIVHQGLTVYGNKGSTDQHAYVQQLRDGRDDFFATFVQVLDSGHDGDVEVAPGLTTGDSLQGFLLGTRRALREAGRRSLTITIPTVDAAAIGALIALFERTVGFYATLVNVNAYDQPGVEAGKKAAKTALDLSVRIREHIAHQPGTAAEIAASLGADPMEVLYLLERLAATDRAARSILGPNAVWSIR